MTAPWLAHTWVSRASVSSRASRTGRVEAMSCFTHPVPSALIQTQVRPQSRRPLERIRESAPQPRVFESNARDESPRGPLPGLPFQQQRCQRQRALTQELGRAFAYISSHRTKMPSFDRIRGRDHDRGQCPQSSIFRRQLDDGPLGPPSCRESPPLGCERSRSRET